MNPLITLRCPCCKSTKRAERDDFDPYGTETVEIICPACDDGDFSTPEFFDKNGKWINPAGEAA